MHRSNLAPALPQGNDAPRPYVLLVEDDPSLLELMRMVLEHAGFRVGTASTAEAFYRALRGGPPDAVSLDLSIPGLSLSELLEDLADRSWPTRVAVVSGSVERGEIHGVPVLEKPPRPEALVRLFTRLCLPSTAPEPSNDPA